MHPEEARPTLAQFRFHIRPIAHNILRFAVLAVILALSAVVVAGCGIFDPKKGGGIPPDPLPEYVVPSQPEYVLTNLETAYSHRDSVGCKALYDPNYVGTSEDLNDPPGTVPAAFT